MRPTRACRPASLSRAVLDDRLKLAEVEGARAVLVCALDDLLALAEGEVAIGSLATETL